MLFLYTYLQTYLNQFKSEEGQGMAEYALIIALIAVALVLALNALTGGISGTFDDIIAEL